MKPLKTLGTHGAWTLRQRDQTFMVQHEGRVVLSSRNDGHESDLVRLGLMRADPFSARVLVGGLGFGRLLREVLDQVGDAARITVLEFSDAMLAWNQGPLAELSGNALQDDRVTVHGGDALAYLANHRAAYDVVLLDLDAGPFDVDAQDDLSMYSLGGMTCIKAAMASGGRVTAASKTTHAGFNKRLTACGFHASVEKVGERLYFFGDVR